MFKNLQIQQVFINLKIGTTSHNLEKEHALTEGRLKINKMINYSAVQILW